MSGRRSVRGLDWRLLLPLSAWNLRQDLRYGGDGDFLSLFFACEDFEETFDKSFPRLQCFFFTFFFSFLFFKAKYSLHTPVPHFKAKEQSTVAQAAEINYVDESSLGSCAWVRFPDWFPTYSRISPPPLPSPALQFLFYSLIFSLSACSYDLQILNCSAATYLAYLICTFW